MTRLLVGRLLLAGSFLVALALAGCNGSSNNHGVSVSIAPASATVPIGGNVAFKAAVSGAANPGVVWSVAELGGGTVTQQGVYTPPPIQGTYHVVATSQQDPTQSAVATVRVTASGVSMTTVPATATVFAGQSLQLQTTVRGTTNTAVTYAVQENGGGTVSPAGLYTAPISPTTTQTFHVIVTSQADPTLHFTVAITVPVVGLSILPASVTLGPGGQQQFSATVTNGATNVVQFAVQEGSAGGTITATGLYTAPVSAGTYHVIATTPADPNKTAVAVVTVLSTTGVVVTVTPPTPTLLPGGTQQFQAAVAGTPNKAVIWSVQEGNAGGSVTATGLYTAPAVPGTYHVLARSVADPTQQGVATITVPPIAVVVRPSTATIQVNQTLQLIPTVTGTTNTQVSYTVLEGPSGGTVSASGLYIAPAIGGIFHIKVTSLADTTKSAIVTITVEPVPVGTGTIIIN